MQASHLPHLSEDASPSPFVALPNTASRAFSDMKSIAAQGGGTLAPGCSRMQPGVMCRTERSSASVSSGLIGISGEGEQALTRSGLGFTV